MKIKDLFMLSKVEVPKIVPDLSESPIQLQITIRLWRNRPREKTGWQRNFLRLTSLYIVKTE